jgi:glycosyltransferase involved in cell wall biosynthesis
MDKKKTPLVSIIMPAYNQERFIDKAIESVFSQSYSNWELIIVDDGSTDSTREKIQQMVNSINSSQIKLIVQDHKGAVQLSVTYSTALKHAQGELVAILEGDDAWPSYKLKVQVPDFEDQSVVLSFGNYAWIDPGGRIIRNIRLSRYLPSEVLSNNPIGIATWYMAGLACRTFTFPCSVVVRRSTLEMIGGFQGLPSSVNLVDFPTFLELSTKGRFTYHDLVLGYWRRHLRSLTTNYREDIYRSAFNYSLDFLITHPEYKRDSIELVYVYWKRALAYTRFEGARANLVANKWIQASEV